MGRGYIGLLRIVERQKAAVLRIEPEDWRCIVHTVWIIDVETIAGNAYGGINMAAALARYKRLVDPSGKAHGGAIQDLVAHGDHGRQAALKQLVGDAGKGPRTVDASGQAGVEKDKLHRFCLVQRAVRRAAEEMKGRGVI